MIPDRQSGNVYTTLLYQALERAGIRYVPVPFSLSYLLRHAPEERFHYLHFHWPEVFFRLRPRAPHRLFGLKGYMKLHAFWSLARRRGYRLAWTVHEVDVHDRRALTQLHSASRQLLWRGSDVVFTHAAGVRAEAVRRWGARPHLHTIPIGSYEGAYAATLTRAEARRRLGVPDDAFAFVFFGNVRPYKGIDTLLASFRSVQREHPNAHLIIAGRPYSPEFAAFVRDSVRELANTHLSLERVPDDEVQTYLLAGDCFVAPYKYIETCSAIYLALAFSLPIIIKSEGNVVDFAEHDIGVLMDDSRQTAEAMRRVLTMPASAFDRLRGNARAASQLFAWSKLEPRYREAFSAFENEQTTATNRGSRGVKPLDARQPAVEE
jgi:glycosyltransferase involved in cell wall biosynthesis